MTAKIREIIFLSILYFVVIPPRLSTGQQVPCLFFMGDSLFDNGNNNVGPTVRFSNGEIMADFLGDNICIRVLSDDIFLCIYIIYLFSDLREYKIIEVGSILCYKCFLIHIFPYQAKDVQELYKDGARKICVLGLGLLGCLPQVVSTVCAW